MLDKWSSPTTTAKNVGRLLCLVQGNVLFPMTMNFDNTNSLLPKPDGKEIILTAKAACVDVTT